MKEICGKFIKERVLFAAVLLASVFMLAAGAASSDAYAAKSVSTAGVSYYTDADDAADALRAKMVSRSSSVTLYLLTSSSSSGTTIAKSVLSDAKEYTGEADEGDYLANQYSKVSYTTNKTTYTEGYLVKMKFTFTWNTTSSQESKVTSKVKSIISSLGLDDLSDYNKIKAIHKYLASNVSYRSSSTIDHTAYGALINGKAACEGYSLAFYRIANAAGISCRYVKEDDVHSWNMVKLSSKWYYCDACWDAGNSTYQYLLLGSTHLAKIDDHDPDSTYGYTVSKGDYMYASLSYSSATYTGSALKPTVTVRNGAGTKLTSGTHYSVSYSSNTSIGTATVKITGKGNYSGSTVSKTFTIVPKQVTISSASSSSSKKLTVKWSSVSGGCSYQIAYKKTSASSWSYATVGSSTYSKTLSSLTSGSKYYVKVRAYKKVSGTTYYGSYSSTKTVTVK